MNRLNELSVSRDYNNFDNHAVIFKIGDTEERMSFYLGESPKDMIASLLKMVKILSDSYTENIE
jgi:hypothetical protein